MCVFSSSFLPSAPATLPYSRSANPALTIAGFTGGSFHSSCVKARPATGVTPRIRKKFGVTSATTSLRADIPRPSDISLPQ